MRDDVSSLDDYNPKMPAAEFYEAYGEDPYEWQKYADELLNLEKEIGYQINFVPNEYGIFPSRLSPFNLYFINRNLKRINSGLTAKDIFRKPNSHGLRSDEFKTEHDGLHIVFAGCSITFGDGMLEEYTWPTLVLNEIAKTHKVSGMYNLGFNGANHIQIFTQIWAYIEKFGAPEILFINFPDIRRLVDAGVQKEALFVITTMYNSLDMYCKKVGTKLVSFSWDTEINFNAEDRFIEQMIFDPHKDPRTFFADTFHRFDVQDRLNHMFDYEQNNPDHLYKDFFVRGLDVVHPGLAEHSFYARRALEWLGEI